MCKNMTSRTFEWPKNHKMVLDGFKSTIFQCYMKHIFIYVLVPIPSLGSINLCIMCVETIAGQKSTAGYIALSTLLSITYYYFDSCIEAAFGIL